MANLQITTMMVPSSKYSIKCPYSMNPSSITRHDTYNDASAMAEVSYMIGNNNQVSYHYAVDDYRAVQGLPTNRNSWSVGDGSKPGSGNRNTISVETCYSKSGGSRYVKAADNVLTLIAMLMKEHGIPATRVYYHRHWSGKNCPHRLIAQGVSETQFQQMVQNRYNEMYGGGNVVVNPLPPTGTSYKVGDVVTISGVYTSSGSNTQLRPSRNTGTITKIVSGARNPYLLDNGDLGWVNDACIVSGGSSGGSGGSSITTIAQEVINGKWGNGDDRRRNLEAAGYNYDAVQAEVNRILNGGGSSSSSKKSISTIADEVIAGKWGNGDDRRRNLEAAGYNFDAVQAEVNRKLGAGGGSSSSSKKSISTIADEVIAGKWGTGETRKQKLKAAGYDYNAVQAEVNRKLGAGRGSSSSKKSNKEIAKEVIAGKWGNGETRKQKLKAAGYDYNAVQAEVNKLL